MSESATTDHQDPQKSVLLKIYTLPRQSQTFTQQSTPAVYAFAVPEPTARPKITATAKAAFITTLLCALLRIMEFTIIIVTINSLHSAGEMTDDRYRGLGSSLSIMSIPLFLSVVLSIVCGFYIFRGYDWARVVVSIMVFLGFTSVYIYTLHTVVDKRIEGRTVSKDAWNFRYFIHAPDNLYNAVDREHRSVCIPVAARNQRLYVQLQSVSSGAESLCSAGNCAPTACSTSKIELGVTHIYPPC